MACLRFDATLRSGFTDEALSPPSGLPGKLVDLLAGYSPERLRRVAAYAEQLAAHRERAARLETDDRESSDERPSELPEGVPSKASITVKEINDNRYYYWQWREGEQIKSKYKGPVNSDD